MTAAQSIELGCGGSSPVKDQIQADVGVRGQPDQIPPAIGCQGVSPQDPEFADANAAQHRRDVRDLRQAHAAALRGWLQVGKERQLLRVLPAHQQPPSPAAVAREQLELTL